MAKAKLVKKPAKKAASKEVVSKAKKTSPAKKKAVAQTSVAAVKKPVNAKKPATKTVAKPAKAKSAKVKGSSVAAKEVKIANKSDEKVGPAKALTKSNNLESVSGARSQDARKSPSLKNSKTDKVAALAVKHLETRESAGKPRPAVVFDPTMAALSETANTPLEKLAKKWNSLFKKASKIETKPYNMRKVFEEKTAIEHKTMGWGYILSNKNDRLEVLFKDGVRFLISNYQG